MCRAGIALTFALACLPLAFGGCGDDERSATIGEKGGKVVGPDGVTLEVPPGALEAPVTFSISVSAAAKPQRLGVVGKIYDIGPSGTTFLKPVTVTLPVDASALPAGISEKDLAVYTADDATSPWKALPSTALGGQSSALVTHLSLFSVAPAASGAACSDPLPPVVETWRVLERATEQARADLDLTAASHGPLVARASDGRSYITGSASSDKPVVVGTQTFDRLGGVRYVAQLDADNRVVWAHEMPPSVGVPIQIAPHGNGGAMVLRGGQLYVASAKGVELLVISVRTAKGEATDAFAITHIGSDDTDRVFATGRFSSDVTRIADVPVVARGGGDVFVLRIDQGKVDRVWTLPIDEREADAGAPAVDATPLGIAALAGGAVALALDVGPSARGVESLEGPGSYVVAVDKGGLVWGRRSPIALGLSRLGVSGSTLFVASGVDLLAVPVDGTAKIRRSTSPLRVDRFAASAGRLFVAGRFSDALPIGETHLLARFEGAYDVGVVELSSALAPVCACVMANCGKSAPSSSCAYAKKQLPIVASYRKRRELVTTDGAGNVYRAGFFKGTYGSITATNPRGDAYLDKQAVTGSSWRVRIESAGTLDYSHARLHVAHRGGTVFVSGTKLAAVVAFDDATGSELWRRELPGGGPLAFDASGKLYIAGALTEQWTAPNAATFSSQGYQDLVVTTLDSATGAWLSSRVHASADDQVVAQAIAVSPTGDDVVVTSSSRPYTLDGAVTRFRGGTTTRVSLFANCDGSALWGSDVPRIEGLALTSSGDIVVAGTSNCYSDVLGSAWLRESRQDIFVAKLRASDLSLAWATSTRGRARGYVQRAHVEPGGGVVIAGFVRDYAIFGASGFSGRRLDSSWFVSKLTAEGDFVCANSTGDAVLEDDGPDGGLPVDGAADAGADADAAADASDGAVADGLDGARDVATDATVDTTDDAAPTPSCPSKLLGFEGCCAGEQLWFCSAGRIHSLDCSGKPSCGWDALRRTYTCGTGGSSDPGGVFAKSCGALIPDAGVPAGCSCLLDGACYADGENNPADACQSCRSSTATDVWTQAAAGGGCPACVAKPSGLVGWWRAEGNASDAQGNSAAGTEKNGVAYVAGRSGKAWRFDGVDDRVEIPHHATQYSSGSFSIEAWVRTMASARQGIATKYECGGSVCDGSSLYQLYMQGKAAFWMRDSDGGGATGNGQGVAGTQNINDGKWHHIVAVRDVSSSELRLYVDGALDRTVTLLANLHGALQGVGETDPLVIGAFSKVSVTPGFEHHFKGDIDEVGYYDAALSTPQVAALFAAGGAGKCP